jgi:hypothetical protein
VDNFKMKLSPLGPQRAAAAIKMSDVPDFPDLAPSNGSILDRILQQLDLNEQWQQQHQQSPPQQQQQQQDVAPQQQQQQQQEQQQAPQQQQFIFGPPSQNLFQFGAMPASTGSPAQPPARRGGRLQKKQVQQPQQPKKRGKRCT